MNILAKCVLIIVFGTLCVSCADRRSDLEKLLFPNGTPPNVTFEQESDVSPVDDEPRNKAGAEFLTELSTAVGTADRIVAVEHSYVHDFAGTKGEVSQERVYRTAQLSAADKEALLAGLASTNPHVSGWAAACAFVPHHRLEFYSGSERTQTLEICFECGQFEWSGSDAAEPGDVYDALESAVLRVGMLPDRDWVRLANDPPSV